MSDTERHRCPYTGCGFEGTADQLDQHRATGVHDDQPQAGSNLRARGSDPTMTATGRVTIDTRESGAVASGTTRDHAGIMKEWRWRWSRNLGAWYLPRTFRSATVDRYVAATASALRSVGVEVEVIDGPRDGDETRAARRLERDRDLVEINQQRAARAGAAADAAWQQARSVADMIPPGQPILVGHHSEARHRRDLARIDRAMRRSIDADETSKSYSRRAASAARRVEAAEAERTVVDPATIRPGDHVRAETPRERRDHGWHRVIRVNKTTVTVPALVGGDAVSWTDRIPLDHIVELRRRNEGEC